MRAALGIAWAVLVGSSLATYAGPAAEPSQLPASGEDAAEIPASAAGLENPLRASEDTLRTGAALWRNHCESCHGNAGRGDGPEARSHELRRGHAPRDLTDPKVQENLTDGELFWRISKGIVEDGDKIVMPAYERKLPLAAQRWAIVLVVRQLGRGTRQE